MRLVGGLPIKYAGWTVYAFDVKYKKRGMNLGCGQVTAQPFRAVRS